MAYRIKFKDRILRLYFIFDFINKVTFRTIDCTTENGQLLFCSLFSFKKIFALTKHYNTQILILKINKDIIIHKSYIDTLFNDLDERSKRRFSGTLSLMFNKINKGNLASICGLSTKTLLRGKKEILNGLTLAKGRIRTSGGGRKSKTQEYNDFLLKLSALIEDHVAGDPMNSRRWIRKSLRYFQQELEKENIKASRSTIKKYFKILGISLKVNKKKITTKQYPNRDLQFKKIKRFKR